MKMILVTAHRRENFGEPIRRICLALKQLAERGDVEIVYPVHLNPNIQGPVHELLDGVPGIRLLEPVDYREMAQLMKRAWLILTDSGGIQEEAPAFGVPVLVLRDTTERPEAVEAGTAKVVGTSTERIVSEAVQLLEDEVAHAEMARSGSPFGDGQAAKRIVGILNKEQFNHPAKYSGAGGDTEKSI